MSYVPELAYDLNHPDPFNPTTGEVLPVNVQDHEFDKAFAFPGAVAPGVYFNMPEEQYHAIPALSASGIKHILTSSMDFWARSWLNQFRDEDRSEEDSEAKDIGKAYHVRLLEGRERFYQTYAPAFVCDNPNALRTVDDLKTRLALVGVTEGLSKLKKAGFVDLLKKADPTAVIYEELEAAHIAEHPGKQFLSWKLIRKMELSAAMIEKHPELKYYFVGGYPEVTVIFYLHGLLFKIRIDYLKVKALNDLKTFANQMGKRIERAIYADVTNNKYFVPGSLYLIGSDEAKEHIRAGRIFGAPPPPEWLEAFQNSPPHDMNFVFQQKGVAPVTRAALYSRKDAMFDVALDNIRFGCDQFKDYWRTYQADPWVCKEPGIVLQFSDYPSYAGQI